MANDLTNGGPAAILLVDDEEMVRNLLSRALRSDNHIVVTAGSKKEAFEQLSQTRFNLLIVDKNLPDGSGLSIVEGARNMGLDAEAIVITGYSDTDSAIQAVALGVVALADALAAWAVAAVLLGAGTALTHKPRCRTSAYQYFLAALDVTKSERTAAEARAHLRAIERLGEN